MIGFIRATALLFFLSALFSCATVAQGPKYLESKASQSKPGYAVLYVFREYAEPTMWGATVLINGKQVATLNQRGFTWAYVKPGDTEIKAVWSGMSGQHDSFISIDILENKNYYVDLTGISQGTVGVLGDMYFKVGSGLNEVKPEAAVKRLETCCSFQSPAATTF
jgi:hypothetical protein